MTIRKCPKSTARRAIRRRSSEGATRHRNSAVGVLLLNHDDRIVLAAVASLCVGAEECVRQAGAASAMADRLMFLTMAQTWLNLAEQHERISDPRDQDESQTVGGEQAAVIGRGPRARTNRPETLVFLNVSTAIPSSLKGEPVIVVAIGAKLAKQLADLLRQPQPPMVEGLYKSWTTRPTSPGAASTTETWLAGPRDGLAFLIAAPTFKVRAVLQHRSHRIAPYSRDPSGADVWGWGIFLCGAMLLRFGCDQRSFGQKIDATRDNDRPPQHNAP